MKKIKGLTHSPLFWITQAVVFLVCVAASIHYFPKVFPMVDLSIRMNRAEALKTAQQLALNHHWGPENFRQAVWFDLDQKTQTFVELSGGGSAAFKKVLNEKIYFPYTWEVRHFAEGQSRETSIRFTPDGDFYGFTQKFPEKEKGAALSANAARRIAEATATQEWKVDLGRFKWVESSTEKRPGGRVDHEFVYEREDYKIGEGLHRLKLAVAGDQLSEIYYFLKIPEAFNRKYAEMRSFNNTIAFWASAAMAILYLAGGCAIGLFYLLRAHWVIWKPAVVLAAIIATIQGIERINQFPVNFWRSYDTAVPIQTFLLVSSIDILVTTILDALLLAISFMAAESLTRRAFPHHPQFWRLWKRGNANSVEILGRAVGGYLTVGLFFAFEIVMYFVGTHYLKWWTPSDLLYQPDALASIFPWFTSIAHSFHAGFWEEALFRAVPLAGAALLGNRFGHRKKWIGAAFVLQALVFAAAHANYPAQPSYARVIELIFPSFLFGGIYLVFGLLPGMILHFTYDVASFAIPVFTAKTTGIWIDQLMIVLLCLTPLWVILAARFKFKKWTTLKADELNQAWTPKLSHRQKAQEITLHEHNPPSKTELLVIGVSASVLLFAWFFMVSFHRDTPAIQVTRKDALNIALEELSRHGVALSSNWEPLISLQNEIDEEHKFVWRTEGPEKYHRLVGKYLITPSWTVRFAHFDGDVAERAEEYVVSISGTGQVVRYRHDLPEAREGASLNKEEAYKIAFGEVKNLEDERWRNFKDVSHSSTNLPERTDWQFIYSDSGQNLKTADARTIIRVSGDEVSGWRRYIFVPEEWSRNERAKENLNSVIRTVSYFIVLIVFIIGVISAMVTWTKKRFNHRAFLFSFGGILILEFIQMLNSLQSRIAYFKTSQPKYNQLANYLLGSSVKGLVLSAGLALIIGHAHYRARHSKPFEVRISALLGFGLGIIGVILPILVREYLPPDLPISGRTDGLDFYLPFLNCLGSLERYIDATALFFCAVVVLNQITSHWKHRRGLGATWTLLIGFALSGIVTDNLRTWALTVMTLTPLVYFAMRYYLHTHLSLIPLALAAVQLLLGFKQIQLNPYRGAIPIELLSMLLVLFVSLVWFKRLRKS